MANIFGVLENSNGDKIKHKHDVSDITGLIDFFLPIGHIIYNARADYDPNEIYIGTTWIRQKGVVIIGVDEDDPDFAVSGISGGSKYLAKHRHIATIESDGNHIHSASIEEAGSHSHAASTNTAGNHTHTMQGFFTPKNDYSSNEMLTRNRVTTDPNTVPSSMGGAGNHSHTVTINNGGSHVHTVTLNEGGSHQHTASISEAGTGTAGNLPPYSTKYIWERIA